ncbi:Testis-expressed protein 30 [Podila horticola]|nr:Testis-expressed protein 30 [Podila horticola]
MVQSIEPTEKEISLPVPGDDNIIIQLTTPAESVKLSGYAVVLGPGGAGDENLPHLMAIAKEVARAGHICARYRAKVPNVVASLVTTRFYNKELTDATAEYPPHFIRGLIVCSYPLHGSDSSRAHQDPTLLGIPAHLPMLMISGLEDPLCDPAVFEKALENIMAKPIHVIQIKGAEHSMNFGDDELAAAKKVAVTTAIGQWAAQYVNGVVAGIESDQALTILAQQAVLGNTGKIVAGTEMPVDNCAADRVEHVVKKRIFAPKETLLEAFKDIFPRGQLQLALLQHRPAFLEIYKPYFSDIVIYGPSVPPDMAVTGILQRFLLQSMFLETGVGLALMAIEGAEKWVD